VVGLEIPCNPLLAGVVTINRFFLFYELDYNRLRRIHLLARSSFWTAFELIFLYFQIGEIRISDWRIGEIRISDWRIGEIQKRFVTGLLNFGLAKIVGFRGCNSGLKEN
jgi:hypothetical protein